MQIILMPSSTIKAAASLRHYSRSAIIIRRIVSQSPAAPIPIYFCGGTACRPTLSQECVRNSKTMCSRPTHPRAPPIFDVDIIPRPNCRGFNDGVRKLIDDNPNLVVVMAADWQYAKSQLGAETFYRSLNDTIVVLKQHAAEVCYDRPRHKLEAGVAKAPGPAGYARSKGDRYRTVVPPIPNSL